MNIIVRKPRISAPQAAHRGIFILSMALAVLPPCVALAMTPSQVYERVKDSVVVVKAYDREGKQAGLGSGVVLPSGDILTNFHVVEEGTQYRVGRGKYAVPAFLKVSNPDKDLCLLTAPRLVAEPARIGRTDRIKVGETVFAVGAPQGLELSLSEGIVSQLRGNGPHPLIQTTVAISPGSSGGGLFNAKGELVGITTFYLKGGQNLNFALPVEWIDDADWRKVTIKPKPPPAEWANRAIMLERARNWQGLFDHCIKWREVEPDNSIAWYGLGIACEKLGQYQYAIQAYQEAIRLDPSNDCALYNLNLLLRH